MKRCWVLKTRAHRSNIDTGLSPCQYYTRDNDSYLPHRASGESLLQSFGETTRLLPVPDLPVLALRAVNPRYIAQSVSKPKIIRFDSGSGRISVLLFYPLFGRTNYFSRAGEALRMRGGFICTIRIEILSAAVKTGEVCRS